MKSFKFYYFALLGNLGTGGASPENESVEQDKTDGSRKVLWINESLIPFDPNSLPKEFVNTVERKIKIVEESLKGKKSSFSLTRKRRKDLILAETRIYKTDLADMILKASFLITNKDGRTKRVVTSDNILVERKLEDLQEERVPPQKNLENPLEIRSFPTPQMILEGSNYLFTPPKKKDVDVELERHNLKFFFPDSNKHAVLSGKPNVLLAEIDIFATHESGLFNLRSKTKDLDDVLKTLNVAPEIVRQYINTYALQPMTGTIANISKYLTTLVYTEWPSRSLRVCYHGTLVSQAVRDTLGCFRACSGNLFTNFAANFVNKPLSSSYVEYFSRKDNKSENKQEDELDDWVQVDLTQDFEELKKEQSSEKTVALWGSRDLERIFPDRTNLNSFKNKGMLDSDEALGLVANGIPLDVLELLRDRIKVFIPLLGGFEPLPLIQVSDYITSWASELEMSGHIASKIGLLLANECMPDCSSIDWVSVQMLSEPEPEVSIRICKTQRFTVPSSISQSLFGIEDSGNQKQFQYTLLDYQSVIETPLSDAFPQIGMSIVTRSEEVAFPVEEYWCSSCGEEQMAYFRLDRDRLRLNADEAAANILHISAKGKVQGTVANLRQTLESITGMSGSSVQKLHDSVIYYIKLFKRAVGTSEKHFIIITYRTETIGKKYISNQIHVHSYRFNPRLDPGATSRVIHVSDSVNIAEGTNAVIRPYGKSLEIIFPETSFLRKFFGIARNEDVRVKKMIIKDAKAFLKDQAELISYESMDDEEPEVSTNKNE